PGLTLHKLFGGGGGGSGTGPGNHPVGLPDPVAQLHGLLTRSTPQPVLTYRTTVADPTNYLQVYVLNYDSHAGDWELVRPARGTRTRHATVSPAPGLELSTRENIIQTPVPISQGVGYSGAINFLPVPYWPMRVHVPGSWRESTGTLMLYSDSTAIQ